METQLLIGLLLTILPIFELRGGLPLIVDYTLKNNISIWPYFLIVLILNIAIIFLIFLFLDFFHEHLMNLENYRKVIGRVLKKVQKKIDKVNEAGYITLALIVAVPLPGTGAWTGTLIAWILGLDRLKSFIAIATGVMIAGILILLASLGLLSGIKSY